MLKFPSFLSAPNPNNLPHLGHKLAKSPSPHQCSRHLHMPPQLRRVWRVGFASRRSGLAADTQSHSELGSKGPFSSVADRGFPAGHSASRGLSAISCSIEFSRCPHGSRRRQGVWTTVTVHIGCTCSSVSSQRAFYFRPPILAYHLDIYPRVTLPSIPSFQCDDREICMWFFDVVARRTCGKSPSVRACVTFLKGLFRISRNYYFWLFA